MGHISSAAASGDASRNDASAGEMTLDINELLDQGRFDEAAGWCGKRAASHPDDYLPYLHLGKLAEIAGDYQKAAEFLAEAIVRNVDCGVAYARLSRMFRNLGQLPHAVRALQVAIEMNAAGREAPLDLADMLFELGDKENAKLSYAAALTHNPACGRSKAMLKLLGASIPVTTFESANQRAFGVPDSWRNVNLAIIAPDGNPHWQAFTDIAGSFCQSFTDMGIDCTRSRNQLNTDAINIVFGAHLIQSHDAAARLPSQTIIFNLEQLAGFGINRLPVYADMLRRFTVWDYSRRNIQALNDVFANPNVVRVGIGYASSLSRVPYSADQTTDVLFYGSLNERRAEILEQLTRAGLNVKHVFNCYGEALDREVANAKVVLNMHFYEDSIHEIVRTSYLLANRKAIVSECNANTEIEPSIRDAMRAVAYADLADACTRLVQDDDARRQLEDDGFSRFSAMSQGQFLVKAIEATRCLV